MAVWPHLTVPSSGSRSPVRIWNRAVWAFSLSPTKAILSPWPTMKLTLSSTFTPSMVLLTSVTKRMSLPTSRSGEKATQG